MLVNYFLAIALGLGAQHASAAAIPEPLESAMLAPRSYTSSANLLHRSLDCSKPVGQLTASDCQRLAKLGFASAGVNAQGTPSSGSVALGGNSKFKGVFKNTSGQDVILVMWNDQFGFASSFVASQQPRLTVSIAAGQSTTVAFDDRVSGAWSVVDANTQLRNGQIANTWGEFTTGSFATVDVSREPNMQGSSMSITTPAGCVSNMNKCVFVCKSGSTCFEAGSFALNDCSGPNTANGGPANAPSGGCQGWSNGGALQVELQ